jgi:pimeloyl-ACP methyl ester carboxylesterase
MRLISDPALLLHGQPGSAYDWKQVETAIGARLRTIAIARPGWDGRSEPLDLAGNARAAVAALDDAGVGRATVVGHSLGGAIAAWMAIEYPERVQSLVLAAPSATCDSLNRLDELLATPVLGPALTTGAFVSIGLGLRTQALRRRLTGRLGVSDGYLRRYTQLLLNPLTWHAFVVEQRMLVRKLPSLEARLGEISAPTTIAIGTADRIVTPSSARSLAAMIPGARLVRLKGASHLLLLERPGELAELIVASAGGSGPG